MQWCGQQRPVLRGLPARRPLVLLAEGVLEFFGRNRINTELAMLAHSFSKIRLAQLIVFCLMVCLGSSWLRGQDKTDGQRARDEPPVFQPVRPQVPVALPAVRAVPAMPLMPAVRPAGPFDLSTLTLAKMDADSDPPRLILLLEQFRSEEGTIQVHMIRQEKRVQKFTVLEDGKPVTKEREVNVMVPFVTTRTGQVQKSAGKKPKAIPFEEVKIYRLDGSVVSIDQAAELLANMKPVFLIEDLNRKIEPADDLIRQALKPDVLVVVRRAPAP